MPDSQLELVSPIEINPPQPSTDTALAPTAEPPRDIRYLCRHVFADGRRCGSPALKTQDFCYYHYLHRPHENYKVRRRRKSPADLEIVDGLDNHTSVQLTLTRVIERIANNQIDPKRAGLLLYALQLAGQNLRLGRTTENAVVAPAIVEDIVYGPIAELEQGREEADTVSRRLRRPNRSRPFIAFDPPYEVSSDEEQLIRLKEGLKPADPLFPPQPNLSLD